MVYVTMIIVIFSLLITQANPAFLQNKLLSKKLFAYSLLDNFSDICQLVWLTKNTSYENVGGIFL